MQKAAYKRMTALNQQIGSDLTSLHETTTPDNPWESLAEDPGRSAETTSTGPILLLGPPGVGKGTQARILSTLWRVPSISPGDILRANIAAGAALGKQADSILKSGSLVPDSIITEMISCRLGSPDTTQRFILDGFPRTFPQAQWLDEYLHIHYPGAPHYRHQHDHGATSDY